MNRKGIELSVNFIVMMILAIVIFVFGFFIVKNILSGAEDIRDTLDRQTIMQIESMLDQGERVALPMPHAEVKRGETHIFGIGVLNVLEYASTDFKVTVEFKQAYKRDKSALCDSVTPPGVCNMPAASFVEVYKWLIYDSSTHTLLSNEEGQYVLGVKVPKDAPDATFVFDIDVKYENSPGNWESYAGVKKAYVKVIT